MKTTRNFKSAISLIMALVMVAALIPAAGISVVAAEDTITGNISDLIAAGQKEFVISTVSDWSKVANYSDEYYIATGGTWTWAGMTLKLGADIRGEEGNLSALRVLANNFQGIFDGDGHTIEYVTNTSHSNSILFRHVNGATVKNVTLKNCTVQNLRSNESGNGLIATWINSIGFTVSNVVIDNCTLPDYVSGVALGYIVGKDAGFPLTVTDTVIKNCNLTGGDKTGFVTGRVQGVFNVDGLQILDCNFNATSGDTGVIVGYAANTSAVMTLNNVYISGVTATSAGANIAMVSSAFAGKTTISNSVFSGTVINGHDTRVGLLFGREQDVAAENKLVVNNCAFDVQWNANETVVMGKLPLVGSWNGNAGSTVAVNNCVDVETTTMVYGPYQIANGVTWNGTAWAATSQKTWAKDDSVLKLNKSLTDLVKRDANGFILSVGGQITAGYQQSAVGTDGTYSVRFIALSQLETAADAGIKIVVKNAGTDTVVNTFDTTKCDIYDTLSAYDAESGAKITSYNAADFGAEKFMAVILTNIPTGTAYDYEITPHYVTEGGITITGKTIVAKYDANGTLTNADA